MGGELSISAIRFLADHQHSKIMTGTVPFANVKNAVRLVMDICAGQTPDIENEQSFDGLDELRALVRRCWAQEPADRPGIEECISILESFMHVP